MYVYAYVCMRAYIVCTRVSVHLCTRAYSKGQ